MGDYAFATNADGSIHAVTAPDIYQAGATVQTFDVWVTAADASAAAAAGDTLQVFSTSTATQTIVTDGLQVELHAGSAHVNLRLGDAVHSLQLRDHAGVGVGAHVQANDLGDSLIGASGADTLVGGAGADTLTGGAGQDVLTGSGGADLFNFTGLTGSVTEITDFTSNVDEIGFSTSGFGVGPFAVAFTTGSPTTYNPTVVYDHTHGDLYYDADGQGSGAAVKFAHLDGAPTVAFSDLFIY